MNTSLLQEILATSLQDGPAGTSPSKKLHITKCGYCLYNQDKGSWFVRFKPFGTTTSVGVLGGNESCSLPTSKFVGRFRGPPREDPPSKLVLFLLKRAELRNILKVAHEKVKHSRTQFQKLLVKVRDGSEIDLAPCLGELLNVKRLNKYRTLEALDYALADLKSDRFPISLNLDHELKNGKWKLNLPKQFNKITFFLENDIQDFIDECLQDMHLDVSHTEERQQVAGAATGEMPRESFMSRGDYQMHHTSPTVRRKTEMLESSNVESLTADHSYRSVTKAVAPPWSYMRQTLPPNQINFLHGAYDSPAAKSMIVTQPTNRERFQSTFVLLSEPVLAAAAHKDNPPPGTIPAVARDSVDGKHLVYEVGTAKESQRLNESTKIAQTVMVKPSDSVAADRLQNYQTELVSISEGVGFSDSVKEHRKLHETIKVETVCAILPQPSEVQLMDALRVEQRTNDSVGEISEWKEVEPLNTGKPDHSLSRQEEIKSESSNCPESSRGHLDSAKADHIFNESLGMVPELTRVENIDMVKVDDRFNNPVRVETKCSNHVQLVEVETADIDHPEQIMRHVVLDSTKRVEPRCFSAKPCDVERSFETKKSGHVHIESANTVLDSGEVTSPDILKKESRRNTDSERLKIVDSRGVKGITNARNEQWISQSATAGWGHENIIQSTKLETPGAANKNRKRIASGEGVPKSDKVEVLWSANKDRNQCESDEIESKSQSVKECSPGSYKAQHESSTTAQSSGVGGLENIGERLDESSGPFGVMPLRAGNESIDRWGEGIPEFYKGTRSDDPELLGCAGSELTVKKSEATVSNDVPEATAEKVKESENLGSVHLATAQKSDIKYLSDHVQALRTPESYKGLCSVNPGDLDYVIPDFSLKSKATVSNGILEPGTEKVKESENVGSMHLATSQNSDVDDQGDNSQVETILKSQQEARSVDTGSSGNANPEISLKKSEATVSNGVPESACEKVKESENVASVQLAISQKSDVDDHGGNSQVETIPESQQEARSVDPKALAYVRSELTTNKSEVTVLNGIPESACEKVKESETVASVQLAISQKSDVDDQGSNSQVETIPKSQQEARSVDPKALAYARSELTPSKSKETVSKGVHESARANVKSENFVSEHLATVQRSDVQILDYVQAKEGRKESGDEEWHDWKAQQSSGQSPGNVDASLSRGKSAERKSESSNAARLAGSEKLNTIKSEKKKLEYFLQASESLNVAQLAEVRPLVIAKGYQEVTTGSLKNVLSAQERFSDTIEENSKSFVTKPMASDCRKPTSLRVVGLHRRSSDSAGETKTMEKMQLVEKELKKVPQLDSSLMEVLSHSHQLAGLIDPQIPGTAEELKLDVNIEPSTGEAATASDAAEVLALTATDSFDLNDDNDFVEHVKSRVEQTQPRSEQKQSPTQSRADQFTQEQATVKPEHTPVKEQSRQEQTSVKKQPGPEQTQSRQEQTPVKELLGLEQTQSRPEQTTAEDQSGLEQTQSRPKQMPAEDQSRLEHLQSRPEEIPAEEQSGLKQAQSRPEQIPAEDQSRLEHTQSRPGQTPAGDQSGLEHLQSRPEQTPVEEKLGLEQTRFRPEQSLVKEQPGLEQTQSRPEQIPAKEQSGLEQAQSRPEQTPVEEQSGLEHTQSRPEQIPAEEQPGLEQTQSRPGQMPVEEQTGLEHSKSRPEQTPVKKHPGLEHSQSRQEQMPVEEQLGLEQTQSRPEQTTAEFQPGLEQTEQIPAEEQSGLKQSQSRPEQIPAEDQSRLEHTQCRPGQTPAEDQSGLEHSQSRPEQTPVEEQLGLEQTQPRPVQIPAEDQSGLEQTQSRPDQIPAKEQSGLKQTQSRPERIPAEEQPGPEHSQSRPEQMPVKEQTGLEHSQSRPEQMPVEEQSGLEQTQSRPEQTIAEDQSGLEKTQSRPEQILAEDQSGHSQSRPEQIPAKEQSGLKQTQSRLEQIPAEDQSRLERTQSRPGQTPAEDQSGLEHSQSRPEQTPVEEQLGLEETQSKPDQIPAKEQSGLEQTQSRPERIPAEEQPGPEQAQFRAEQTLVEEQTGLEHSQSRPEQMPVEEQSGLEQTQSRPEQTIAEDQSGLEKTQSRPEQILAEDQSGHSQSRPEQIPAEEQSGLKQTQSRPEQIPAEDQSRLEHTQCRPEQIPAEDQSGLEHSQSRPEQTPVEEQLGLEQTQPRPVQIPTEDQSGLEQTQSRPDQIPAKEQSGLEQTQSRPERIPAEEQPGPEQAQFRSEQTLVEAQSGLEHSQSRPEQMPVEGLGLEQTQSRLEQIPAKEQSGLENSQSRPEQTQSIQEQTTAEDQSGLEQTQSRPKQMPAQDQSRLEHSQSRPEQIPAEQSGLEQAQSRPEQIPAEDQSRLEHTQSRPGQTPAGDQSELEQTQSRPEQTPVKEQLGLEQTQSRPEQIPAEDQSGLEQTQPRPEQIPAEEQAGLGQTQSRLERIPAEEQPGLEQAQSRPEQTLVEAQSGPEHSQCRLEQTPVEDQSGLEQIPAEDQSGLEHSQSRPEQMPVEEQSGLEHSQSIPEQTLVGEQPGLDHTQSRAGQTPVKEQSGLEHSQSRPEQTPVEEQLGKEETQFRPEQTLVKEQPGLEKSQSRPGQTPAEDQSGQEHSQSRPEQTPVEEQLGLEQTQPRPVQIPAEDQSGLEQTQPRPDQIPAKEQSGLKQTQSRPERIPAEEQPGPEQAQFRSEQTPVEEQTGLEHSQSRPEQILAEDQSGLENSQSRPEQIPAEEQSILEQTQSRPDQKNVEDQIRPEQENVKEQSRPDQKNVREQQLKAITESSKDSEPKTEVSFRSPTSMVKQEDTKEVRIRVSTRKRKAVQKYDASQVMGILREQHPKRRRCEESNNAKHLRSCRSTRVSIQKLDQIDVILDPQTCVEHDNSATDTLQEPTRKKQRKRYKPTSQGHWDQIDHRQIISDFVYGGNDSLPFGDTPSSALKAVEEKIENFTGTIETSESLEEEKMYQRSVSARARFMHAEKAARLKEKLEYEGQMRRLENLQRRSKKTPEQLEYEAFLERPIIDVTDNGELVGSTDCSFHDGCRLCGQKQADLELRPVILAPSFCFSSVTDCWREPSIDGEPETTMLLKKGRGKTNAAPKRSSGRSRRNANKTGMMLVELKHSLEFIEQYNRGYLSYDKK